MARTFSRRELLGNAGRYGLGAMALGSLTDPKRLAGMLADQKAAKLVNNTSSPPPGPLVFGTLYGGYDGLNLVCPYLDVNYAAARPTMSVAQSVNVIDPGLGLHPALLGISALWSAGQVAIITGVGMPNPNYSHFSSMAQWMAGTEDLSVDTGWVGRYLDGLSANPLNALSIGGVLPQLLVGASQQGSGVSDTDVSANQSVPGGPSFQPSYSLAQTATGTATPLQAAVATSGANLVQVAGAATSALASQAPLSVAGRSGGDFGQQLSIVGQLILNQTGALVYQASMGGFDTHSNELNAQASLFAQLDAAVTAFFNGIGTDSSAQGTVLVLYTEFGRQVRENGSVGTDHGNGNTMFVIGPSVKGGLYGTYPSLSSLDGAGALIQNVDFRSVWTTLLQDVLGLTAAQASTVLGGTYTKLGFI